MKLPVAILAGGLATRLYPITESKPKSLVEVAGEPFICRQLSYLHAQGIERVVLCVGKYGEMVEDLIGNGKKFNLEVIYSYDGSTPLGTGGALKQAVSKLGDHFFVLYGDSYLPIDFSKVKQAFVEQDKLALMTIFKNTNRWDKSNVDYQNKALLEYDKFHPKPTMQYIDYGLGIMSSKVFDNYPAKTSFDLATIYQRLAKEGKLAGYEVIERFYEVGSHQGLAETNQYFLKSEQ